VVICLQQGADLHTAQLMPLPLTVSCFCKIQIGFTFLVPAHPASPRQRAVKWVCVTADQSFFFLMPDILYDARANTWQKDEMAECILSLHRFLCHTEASIFHTTRVTSPTVTINLTDKDIRADLFGQTFIPPSGTMGEVGFGG